MRCATAGRLVTERRGRPGHRLPPILEAELARHLAGCPACAADAALETRLAQQLTRGAAGAAVPSVDVRARVLIALVSEPPVDRRAVSPRQLALGAVAGGTLVAAAALVAAWVGPVVADRVADAGVVPLLGGWLEHGGRTVRALGVAAIDTLRAVWATLVELLRTIPVVRRAWSFAFAALGHLALASMLILSAWWIGRDVLRPARRSAREETSR